MIIIFINKFIISNDSFLKPNYRISPFRTSDISINNSICNSISSHDFLIDYFKNKNYIFTDTGRMAINQALKILDVKKNDCVTIFTTTNNFYISSCVTNEIEKYCQWSRKIEPNTKVILINHEFGFPVEDFSEILSYNLPIIEDCAHSFISQNQNKTVGNIGDFVIYSLPKFFPIQSGGILVAKDKYELTQLIDKDYETYLRKILNKYLPTIKDIKNKRIKNYLYLEESLKAFGLEARFKLKENYCPGAFLFKANSLKNLDEFKIFIQSHGIEGSIFYGESSFFIPINQSLISTDLEFFTTLIKYYIDLEKNCKLECFHWK